MTTLAFAGADGFGANTVGGRGGQVVHVTNLNDTGYGSLRWALEGISGPRIVVFDVGGTINLKSQILIQNPNVTIAGQTAPGEGITLSGSGIRVKADEVIMRGLHIRPGDGAAGTTPDNRDALMVGTTDFVVNNVAIDHNSFAWAVDENVAINGKVQDLTFSNNIVAEGLSNSIHSKGEHSKGLLISNWAGADGDAARISVVRNLFSDNMQRNPEVRAGQQVEIINNFIYNYGVSHAAVALGGANAGQITIDIDVIGNVFTPGLDSPRSSLGPIFMNDMRTDSHVSLSDNILTSRASDAAGNQDQSTLYNHYARIQRVQIDATATSASGVKIVDSLAVGSTVLNSVGAVNGAGQDSVDARIVREAATGTGTIIDKVSEVFTPSGSTAAVRGAIDSDWDGMPDWFEVLYGFDRKVADDKGDNDLDGFSNVEEYVNGLISGFDLGANRLAATKINLATGGTIGASALTNPVAVTGFSAGKVIDLTSLLGALDANIPTIASAVEIAYANGNSYLSVDADGTGAGTDRKLIAVIENAKVTLSDLKMGTTTGSAPTTDSSPQAGDPVGDIRFSTFIQFVGTSGNDNYTLRTSDERVMEEANAGIDSVVSFVDYTLDANVENLTLRPSAANGTGNALANKIIGTTGANRLTGLDGNDTLVGLAGDDTVLGGNGNDRVEGNDGDDIIVGGLGADMIMGGLGSDTFIFQSADAIASRTAVQDRINDFGAGDRIIVDGQLVDFADVASIALPGASLAKAFDAATAAIKSGEDFALVHGTKDSWLFWDSNHDGTIDSGVYLAGASPTRAAWMGADVALDIPAL